MTPQQKVKWLILKSWHEELAYAFEKGRIKVSPLSLCYPCAEIDELWERAKEQAEQMGYDWINMAEDIRCGSVSTEIKSTVCSRTYEVREVASQLPDGSWVGWPFWYGGGKHGEPSQKEWIEAAYDVSCREETRIVQVFSREK